MDEFFNSIIMGIITPLLNLLEMILNFIFSSRISTLIFSFIFVNLIGFLLMYIDKKRAKEEKYRIKESTLFLSAILFGSLGVWFGMKKFRHKTLHKKFTIGIPLIMVAQVIFIIYSIIKGLVF